MILSFLYDLIININFDNTVKNKLIENFSCLGLNITVSIQISFIILFNIAIKYVHYTF